jgi:hypothetical protein
VGVDTWSHGVPAQQLEQGWGPGRSGQIAEALEAGDGRDWDPELRL